MKRLRFASYVFAVFILWLSLPLRSTGDPSRGGPTPETGPSAGGNEGNELERPLSRPIIEAPGRELVRQIEAVLKTRRSEEDRLVSLRDRATDELSFLRIQQALERWKLETELDIFRVQAQWAHAHQKKHMAEKAAKAAEEAARILKSKSHRTALIQGHAEKTPP